MIRNRWMIPAAAAAVCVLLAMASMFLSKRGLVIASEEGFLAGQAHTWSDLPLNENQRYTLLLRPKSGVRLDTEVVVSAVLLKDDIPVFEIEDAYWHQRGTWSEGGESGTWEEHNSASEFSFLVPETGNYDLEVTLENATYGADRLALEIVWREPWVLAGWPLWIGGILLLGLAGFAHSGRAAALAKFLESMGEGSKVRFGEMEYDVIARAEHWEDQERVGVEFRLRGRDGSERWLAVDRYWREHPYIEDGEQTLVQLLIDVPLTPPMQAALEATADNETHIVLEEDVYWRDRENGGFGVLVAVRNQTPYLTRYTVDIYRDEHRFPRQPGHRWLERIRWRDTQEIEWALMEIVDSDKLDVLDLKPAPTLTRAQIFDQQPNADPFGVAHMRDEQRPIGQQGAAGQVSWPEHETQQDSGRWNS